MFLFFDISFVETEKSIYSGTPPYDHPVYKTTSFLRPYSFKPNIKNIDSFYYFEDPVNATTSLLRPGFYGPTMVALTGFYCIYKRTALHVSKQHYTADHGYFLTQKLLWWHNFEVEVLRLLELTSVAQARIQSLAWVERFVNSTVD